MFLTKSSSHPAFNPVLVHEPVLLRAATLADHKEWVRLREASRDHLTVWEEAWSAQHLTLASFKKRLRALETDRKSGGGLSLLMFRHTDQKMVGGLTVSNIRYGASRSAHLGYWLGAAFVQQGLATAAVRAVMGHAFETIHLNRLAAACQPENTASQKLLERCGFSREGLARSYLKINGEWRDHHIYAVTASDYREMGKSAL